MEAPLDFAEFYAASKDRCLRAVVASGVDSATAEEAVAEAFAVPGVDGRSCVGSMLRAPGS